MTSGVSESLRDSTARHFPPGPPRAIGVAVSGGGDSLALLHILSRIAAERSDLILHAVTVDHGLRPEARDEALYVGKVAGSLGVPHDILTWQGHQGPGWNGQGNLQSRARAARYALISDWAEGRGIAEVAIGHTADDQAETFLMRLARAAGVDGLSGMQTRRQAGPVTLVRPLLDQRRSTLRSYLEEEGVLWVEDPSNEDDHYLRVRVRKTMACLSPIGVTPREIVETAANLAEARAALSWYAHQEALKITSLAQGDVVFHRDAFLGLQPEIARRLLIQAMNWVSGAEYGPRRDGVARALAAIAQQRSITLHGCNVTVTGDRIWISRELAAVAAEVSLPGSLWDGRWRLTGPAAPGIEIRALGEAGIKHCPDWRSGGLPYRSLMGYPSVWLGGTLIAAPHAGFAQGWQADLLRGEDVFFSSLLGH